MRENSPRVVPVFAFLLVLFVQTALFAQFYEGKRVKVTLANGRTLIGTVETQKDGRIYLRRNRGTVWLKLDEIEVEELQDPKEEFADRAKKCTTPDDWVELYKWCKRRDVNLQRSAQQCLDKAVELDPEHQEARKLRGDIKIKGKWHDEETGNKLLGKVKYKGRWITKKEFEKQKQRDALKKNRHVGKLLKQIEEREGRPWATVKPIETSNFFVKCNSTEDIADYYSQLMEDLYESYDELFDEVDYERYYTGKGDVFIFRNHDEFMDFTLYGQGIGGFFSPLDRAVRAYHGSFGVTGTTEMVLAHEATHQFQSRIMRHMRSVPVWLVEGMAVYYGDGTKFSRRGVQLHEIPRDRLHTLKERIRTGRYRPLRDLVRTQQFGFGPFYDHGWGIIYWCLQGEKHGAHGGEGQRVWDKYLQHVCSEEYPEYSEVSSNLKEHYDREGKYFEALLLKETGAKDLETWEEGYKKFISELPLEALGSWKGNTWDGSKKIGIRVVFPKNQARLKLERVEEQYLRMDFREAAAVHSPKDLRIWVGVDANWAQFNSSEIAEAMATRYVSGFFTKVKYEEEPKAEMFRDVADIPLVRAKFKGRFAKRRDVTTFSRGTGQASGKAKQGDGAQAKEAASTHRPDPSKVYNVKIAYIFTSDKVYMLCMAGDPAPFARMEGAFDSFVDSVKLSFASTSQ